MQAESMHLQQKLDAAIAKQVDIQGEYDVFKTASDKLLEQLKWQLEMKDQQLKEQAIEHEKELKSIKI